MNRPMTIPLFNHFFPQEIVAFVSDCRFDFARGNAFLQEGGLSREQKNFLAAELGFVPPDLVDVRQVHGSRVIVATKEFVCQKGAGEEADGLVTNLSETALVVRTADCLPVFMHDPKTKALGLLHAGWRGSHQNIVQEAVFVLRRDWDVQATNLRAALGPAIRPCCYQVGHEFRDYFPKETICRDDGFYLDLPLVNKHQLLAAGILEENIFDCGVCTCCDERFFSYRREGSKAGRMISLLMRKRA